MTVDLDLGRYQLGWSDAEDYVFKPKKGLNENIVREMSAMKKEPEWMRDFRLAALKRFERRPMAAWFAVNMPDLDFDDIYYYIKPTGEQVQDWNDLPDAIKNTYEKLGIPEAERKYLAGVTAQYESEVVFHRNREDLESLGVLFCDMDTAVREYPELVRKYFGTIIPPNDNKFAALNSAVWSGGSFIYVPEGVVVDQPLQAYFRINAENMGQFERTLIIADKGSQVHYVEGCSAPVYTTDSLHSAVVELVALEGSRITYTTIQNWSNNVYNLVTKRARAEAEAHVEWIDGNIGSRLTPRCTSWAPRPPARSSRSPTRGPASTKMLGPRWSTPPPRPARPSCPSPSRRTGGSPPTADWSTSTRERRAPSPSSAATRCSSTSSPSPRRSPTWRWASAMRASATRRRCPRWATTSSST
jgi:Fe-S cluster assembly protein SufB